MAISGNFALHASAISALTRLHSHVDLSRHISFVRYIELLRYNQDDIWLLYIGLLWIACAAAFDAGNVVASTAEVSAISRGGVIRSRPRLREVMFFNCLKKRANEPVVDIGTSNDRADGSLSKLRQDLT
ncbi:hypothetical protein ELE36_10265 [Pseudolysobacter antarcticus]|uniref:Uncharacterized protein n=2 Tax=Pseudolysobacter antarcticus TaxID=2511995 RepID=A0A411HJY7_9GAMM|nr:hypothetical protein ELE36_10265 [Pseudolysobacter antarcticus]